MEIIKKTNLNTEETEKIFQTKLHLIYSDKDEIVATFEILNWEMSHLRGKQTLVKRKLPVYFWDHF